MVDASEGVRRLELKVTAAHKLLEGTVSAAEVKAWTETTKLLLSRIYEEEPSVVRGLSKVGPPINLSAYNNAGEMAEHLRDTLKAWITFVESHIESLAEDARSMDVSTNKSLQEPNRVIISWSGGTSRNIAQALYEWLQTALPGSKPWISIEDIAKGKRWFDELMKQLGESTTCLICVTPENHKAPWVYYEAGVIAAKQAEGNVCTVLFGVTTEAVENTPLSQFQATESTQDDVWRLVKDLNKDLTEGKVSNDELRSIYEQKWPELEAAIKKALKHSPAPAGSLQEIDLVSDYGLNHEAQELLRRACLDSNGQILYFQALDGSELETNGHNFLAECCTPRLEAVWKGALGDLEKAGLVEAVGGKREVFNVTREGYKVGDAL